MSLRNVLSSAASPQRSTSKWMNDASCDWPSPGVAPPASTRSMPPSRPRQMRNTGCSAECSAVSEAVDGHRHRVDEERHVVVDDLDDRVIGMPAVLFEDRVVHAQPLAAGHEFLGGSPVRHRGAVEIGDAAALQIVGIDEIVVVTQEGFDDSERGFGQAPAREFDDVREQVRRLPRSSLPWRSPRRVAIGCCVCPALCADCVTKRCAGAQRGAAGGAHVQRQLRALQMWFRLVLAASGRDAVCRAGS